MRRARERPLFLLRADRMICPLAASTEVLERWATPNKDVKKLYDALGMNLIR